MSREAKKLAVERAINNNLPVLAATFCAKHGIGVEVEEPLAVAFAEMVRFGVVLARYWDGDDTPPAPPALLGPRGPVNATELMPA